MGYSTAHDVRVGLPGRRFQPRTKEAIEKLENFKALAHVHRNPSVWYSTHGAVPEFLKDVTEVHPNFAKLRINQFDGPAPVCCAASSCLQYNSLSV